MNHSLPHNKVVPFKHSADSKKQQVATMFNQIAFRYDFLNQLLSGGIDKYWRRKAIKILSAQQPKRILDVATGTADLAIMAHKYLPATPITGIDISEGMLALGQKKIAHLKLKSHISLQMGDSEAINFDEHTFDAVMVAFGVRNFQDLHKGLDEMLRVLTPNGKLIVLEFSKPKKKIFKWLYKVYMRVITPTVGKWVAKHETAYQYLNDSVLKFPEGNDFLTIMNDVGYTATYLKTLTGGICTIYCGTKKKDSSA
jgi:demethylmenaquinone methyltransferase / 2-methoxy-6-polyprenyl-1,4-benzoquinol methylase